MGEALLVALALFSLPGSIAMLRHPMAAVRALAIIGIAASAFAALAFWRYAFRYASLTEREMR